MQKKIGVVNVSVSGGKCIENVKRKGLHGPCWSVDQQLQREAA